MAKKTTLVVERELHSAKDSKPKPVTSGVDGCFQVVGVIAILILIPAALLVACVTQ